MKAVVYGAGQIGRGFIGALFAQAGYEVVFVDIDDDLVRALNAEGAYSVHIVGPGAREDRITGVRAVHGDAQEQVAREIASCDIMATALGARALRHVAPILARALAGRGRGRPLNILLCENLKGAAALVRLWLAESLPPGEAEDILAQTGLVRTSIGRMVPDRRAPNRLDIYAEEYAFLPADARAFVAPADVPGLMLVEPFAFYEERKLYLHNMGHAVCAYLGRYAGFAYIWEAAADPHIRLIVQNAMAESAASLSQRHSVPMLGLLEHSDDLILRFCNAELADTCERVGRDPARKLAPEDRLVGAARMCAGHGAAPVSICVGIAAALLALIPGGDAGPALADICGLSSGSIRESALIFYDMLRAHAGLGELVAAADRVKRDLRGGPRP